jgi:mannosyl-3-phosphoglycerate phosphatase
LRSSAARTVIFTDLDGTLLNEKYSFKYAKPIIAQLMSLNIAVVFCSSKTRSEIEFYRKEININDPFISENGAAIFIPKAYFKPNYAHNRQTEKYNVIELGVAYSELRQRIERIRAKTDCRIVGFGDMSTEEIARDSGLSLELAKLAKMREYDEPLRVVEDNEKQLLEAIREEGLQVTKGDRYYHLSGKHNKGTAVTLLKELYVKSFGQIRTIGVGNSPNDLPMLEVVDIPVLREKTERIDKTWKRILSNTINLNF